MISLRIAPAAWALVVCACTTIRPPAEAPPLSDLEEPPALFEEPADEAERRTLPPGSFSGVVVGAAGDSLEALLEEPDGLEVVRVVENSPGAAAGVEPGDLLFEYALEGGGRRPLRWPSEWRELELEAAAGTRVVLWLDRAGAERRTELVLTARVAPAERQPVARLREEQRVGVVVRGTTEVEARALGLGPGAGAVIVGLSRASPWRAAGLRYEDCIVAIGGEPVAHPQAVIDAIAAGEPGADLALTAVRDGERFEVEAPLSRRERELTEIALRPIVTYKSEHDALYVSVLFGLFYWEKTAAAWRVRILWLIGFGGGDSDELKEVGG